MLGQWILRLQAVPEGQCFKYRFLIMSMGSFDIKNGLIMWFFWKKIFNVHIQWVLLWRVLAYSVCRHHNTCFSFVELLLVYLSVSRHFGVLQHKKRESLWIQNVVKVAIGSGINNKNTKCRELVKGQNTYLYVSVLCTRFTCFTKLIKHNW